MPDPANYDDESSWMSACVPAVMDEGKPNDQAVAACASMWEDRDKAADSSRITATLPLVNIKVNPNTMVYADRYKAAAVVKQHYDLQGTTPYLAKTRGEGDVDRAWSVLTVKSVDTERREIEGWATRPEVDRVGDIVEPMGCKMAVPMPLLWAHRHDEPVGHVIHAKASKDGISIRARIAKIAEAGPLKDSIDRAWQAVKAGLVQGLSIGFKPREFEPIENGGYRYTKSDIYELSLVVVPALASATITTIKSLDARQLAASGKEPAGLEKSAATFLATAALSRPGASGKSKTVSLKLKERTMSKTVAEQISALESKRSANQARMEAIMAKAMDEGRSTDEAERTEFDDLEAENETVDGDLKRYRGLEKTMQASAKPVEAKSTDDASASRSGNGHVRVTGPQLPPGIAFARVVKCLGIARGNLVGAAHVAEKNYPDDPRIGNILKAAIAAGSTTNTAWAGALVSAEGAVFTEFLEFLRPMTIVGRFGTNGIPSLRNIPFRVPIGSQTTGGTAGWVGEGSAKPLTHFEVARTTLEPLKVAAIVVVTEELLRYASMAAEQWLRDQLVAALRERLDTDFIDPAVTSVPGVRPASITNGVSTVTSAGSSADAVRADIAAVMQNFIAANNLATQSVWIMDATTALRLSMMTTDLGQAHDFARGLSMSGGTFAGIPVIVSEYVGEFAGSPGAANVWLVAADQIFVGDEGGFQVDMSREASLLMDNAPAMSSGGQPASPDTPLGASLVSMYQTNSVALRAERVISWVKARATAVQGISNVQWGT